MHSIGFRTLRTAGTPHVCFATNNVHFCLLLLFLWCWTFGLVHQSESSLGTENAMDAEAVGHASDNTRSSRDKA